MQEMCMAKYVLEIRLVGSTRQNLQNQRETEIGLHADENMYKCHVASIRSEYMAAITFFQT